MTPQLCVICPARPARPVLTDSLACKVCVDELTKLLKDLDEQLPRLRSMVAVGPADGVRTGRLVSAPAPLRIDVLSLLDPRNDKSPGKVLAKWAAVFGTTATPSGLRQALGRIVEHEQLRPFVRELRVLADEVRRACGEQGPAVRRVATCRRDLPAGEGTTRECGGPIMAAPDGDIAVCGRCGDRWPRDRWQLLGRLQAG